MSVANKTRFEIQKIIRDGIIAGLRYDSYDPDSYVVMEANQRPITAKKDCILFKFLSSERNGWQSTKFRVEKDSEGKEIVGFRKDEEFLDVQTWLIAVLTTRPDATNGKSGISADTRLSEDVAQSLIGWFNGIGCYELRKVGVSPLYIKQKPVEIYKDASSLYEKSASFQIKIIVPKRISHQSPYATIQYGGEVPI